MGSISGLHNKKFFFESKCGYIILQLLAKGSPLGSGKIIPVTFWQPQNFLVVELDMF